MRNLKKVLALVLALVMAMSLMVTAGATSLGDYKDSASVSPEYATAVDVATQLGILEGVGNNTYAPQGNLTRAQLATITYRIATGDVTDVYTDNFAGGAAASFTDTPADAWYAGYVGYAADAGYLKGVGEGLYKPNSTLTGYQTLAALLRVIGYNQPGQFTGPDWTVQVAQIATETGILNGLKNVDLNGPITREATALLIYNALFSDIVSYTPAFGYQNDKKADDLATDVFGIVTDKAGETDSIDVWGRPGTVWKNAKGEQVVIIAHEALASYTVETKNCDIYADTDLKAGTELAVCTNGAADGTYTVKNTGTYGAQGRLTEVYADRVVNIDTYLAEVTAINAEKVDSRGHVTAKASIEADVYMSAASESATSLKYYETADVVVGDMVLVTVAKGEIQSMEVAKAAMGQLTKVAGAARTVTDIQQVQGISNEAVTVNHTATLEPSMTVGLKYIYYYDQYGNVIGAANLAKQYAVLDSLYRTTTAGTSVANGDVVFFDASEDVDAAIARVDHDGAPAFGTDKQYNTEYYYTVYSYAEEDGAYLLSDADFNTAFHGEYQAGSVYMMVQGGVAEAKADASNLGVKTLQLSNSTQILLQSSLSPDGTFTSYVGYKDLPSFECLNVQYIDENNDGYIDYLYACGVELTARTVFVYDVTPISTEVTGYPELALATVKALELQNGELEETTFTVLYAGDEYSDETAVTPNHVIDRIGLYEIVESEYGYYYAVEDYEYVGVDSITNDGLRAEIEGRFEALDNAVFAKYEGSWTKGVVSDAEATDLNGESYVYLQRDDDGNVVAVYDIWVKLGVKFAEGTPADAEITSVPALYMGKTMKAPIEIEIPAYYDLDKVEAADAMGPNDLVTGDFTRSGTDKHNEKSALEITTSKALFGDVVITLKADPKHDNTNLVTMNDPANTRNIYVVVDNTNHKVTVKGLLPTVNVGDLMQLIDTECEYAQPVKLYDNTTATPKETGLIDFVNDYIIVTAENGNTQKYTLELKL
ncbi:S-layer homology domain-containing protein [Evtepia sp.]|uniref:S-layer homology domain-containing protein n=1 Tax=Evtepia sp. TaxID=2773933 RepID=UPI002A7FBF59|nr:S-layer homology domain-containing protein [Evtepia sp.]MDY4431278.1 S-layer homology domain-containing protein [Evtepia sp.]